jgi:hypothetical protein
MSFFDSIISAIQSPQHAGSNQDVQNVLNLAQNIPGIQGAEGQILNALGGPIQQALSQQGPATAQQTVTTLSQGNVSVQDLQNLFGVDQFNNIVNQVAARTGISSQLILAAIPMVIPVIMKLLATGNHQTNAQAPNPVLNQFLGGQNGGALLNEVFQLASQYGKK